MKKLMKVIALLLVVIALVSLFVACSHKCDNCGKNGAKHKHVIDGETYWLCDDCEEEYGDILDLAD